jgi:hypothetical protein
MSKEGGDSSSADWNIPPFRAQAGPGIRDAPCDFTLHFGERLGLSEARAQALLAELVSQYQPASPRPICFSTPPTLDLERSLMLDVG